MVAMDTRRVTMLIGLQLLCFAGIVHSQSTCVDSTIDPFIPCDLRAPANSPRACCPGFHCVTVFCMPNVAPPVPQVPADPGCVAPTTNQPLVQCKRTDPSTSPIKCCSGFYCSPAQFCLDCVVGGDTKPCNTGSPQDLPCCQGATCVNNQCVMTDVIGPLGLSVPMQINDPGSGCGQHGAVCTTLPCCLDHICLPTGLCFGLRDPPG